MVGDHYSTRFDDRQRTWESGAPTKSSSHPEMSKVVVATNVDELSSVQGMGSAVL
jgi:hypothetical protein